MVVDRLGRELEPNRIAIGVHDLRLTDYQPAHFWARFRGVAETSGLLSVIVPSGSTRCQRRSST